MEKYAKVLDIETNEVSVAVGSKHPDGYTLMDVEEAFDGRWYVKGYAPEKPQPTADEIKELRKQYRRKYMDDSTAERSRKQANGSWTAEDEIEYIELDERITQEIVQLYPYPSE